MVAECSMIVVQAASQGEGAGPGPGSQQQQQQEQQQQQAPQGRGETSVKHIGSNTMGMVLDLLCFCVQHHGFRSAEPYPYPHCCPAPTVSGTFIASCKWYYCCYYYTCGLHV